MKVRPPLLLRWMFPGTTWRIPEKEKRVYITFDDGPIPEVTPRVVEMLNKYGAKATFFCVGDNVRKHPEVYSMLINNGMATGNHTYSHLKAWQSSKSEYFSDIKKGKHYIGGNLYRPPHGQLYPWYIGFLKRNFSKVVMWDLLSQDWKNDLSADDIYKNVIRNVRSGSIIVFHDSLKAWPRLETALPLTLEFLKREGYSMEIIQ
ncbi:polysaccharide deacetylase family protein [Alkalitalea saponilacus]|uniref:Peptidoglycan/xylan/chitin deacetylase, PgdA/CDA1 family n=2 Tax=Alkalitalea saponilacus TaxID=889453 RepID=A0A1T5HSN8_9BACT|nr:polysaccharide deacetylase family protein [Alkalitalea saponilacus]SKC23704.1 Peptidoglycan/xylan/chitin deacetylase, PgdA/CDA1 family [Alkalitalea saponilacus]